MEAKRRKSIKSLIMIFLIIVAILLFIDIYTFKGIQGLLSVSENLKLKTTVYTIYWGISFLMILVIFLGYFFRSNTRNVNLFPMYYYLFGAFLVLYIPKIIFLIFYFTEDVYYASQLIFNKGNNLVTPENINLITRSRFLSQIGIVAASLPFLTFIWGMVRGRFNFKTGQHIISFTNLPKHFDGLTIVHISDLHLGSFKGFNRQIEEAIRMINAQQPDLILFTGDLVNNFAEEIDGWIPVLKNLHARLGKFSVLGNHDYGNYYHWNSEKEKNENFQKIKDAHYAMGFKLLNNEAEVLNINDEKIAIIGVENWGHRPFPQKGDYKIASKDVADIPFKILLSHDPSHWDQKIVNKTDVDLTLSGHTHGMQFGIQIAGYKWSPSKYKYKRWSGLYNSGKQYLYVNTGLGNIGYPGRVGMAPEITVIELKHSNI